MSLDLQEQTRRDDVFEQLLIINKQLDNLSVFPTLGWVWCFDIIKDWYENYSGTPAEWQEEAIPEGITLKQIFDKFFEDIEKLGIDMDMGGEILEETITDWMRENGFLVGLDQDGWLDQEEDVNV